MLNILTPKKIPLLHIFKFERCHNCLREYAYKHWPHVNFFNVIDIPTVFLAHKNITVNIKIVFWWCKIKMLTLASNIVS